jgi:hypothetical protein
MAGTCRFSRHKVKTTFSWFRLTCWMCRLFTPLINPAYLCYSFVLAGFVYPVVAHSIWSNNGFLSNSNVNPLFDVGGVDFAGSGVVHITGGSTALLATLILGPRRGRFFDAQGEPLDTPKPFPGHSVALQLLGTMILWFACKLTCMQRISILSNLIQVLISHLVVPNSFLKGTASIPVRLLLLVSSMLER